MAVDYVRVVWRCAMTETSKQWFCSVTTVYIDVVVISVKSTCMHTFSFSEGIFVVIIILCFLYNNYFVRTIYFLVLLSFVLLVLLLTIDT